MAQVSLKTIVKLISTIIKKSAEETIASLNDPTKWKDIEFLDISTGTKFKGTVESVSFAYTGLILELATEKGAVTLEARAATKKAQVYVDEARDPEAALIFDYKGSPGNPSRWALDFRPVTIWEDEYRVATRFDP